MAVRKLFPPKVICGAEINAIVDKQELYDWRPVLLWTGMFIPGK